MILIYVILFGVTEIVVANKNIQARNAPTDRKLLFFLSNNKLWQMEINENVVREKLVNNDLIVDYDFDEIKNQLFWIDRAGQIFTRNIYGESKNAFVYRYYLAASGTRIAYNTVADKFYIIDGESQEIDMIDTTGKNQTVLFERDPIKEEHVIREKPRKILLDHRADLMFVLTELNGVKNIYQSKTDGTSKRLLISNIGGDELCINHNEKRIFWANTKQKVIESVDYKGYNRVLVVKIQNSVALNVYKNRLFWLVSESEKGCFKSAIYSCKLERGTCETNPDYCVQLEDRCRNPRSLKILELKHIAPTGIETPMTNKTI